MLGNSKKAAVTRNPRSLPFLPKGKKGFGGVASTLIMFIAIISVTTGLVIAFMGYIETTEQSFKTKNDLTSNKLKTAISISNIYYNSTSNVLYVYVKNIGETKLSTKLFDVFIDNSYQTGYNVTYASDLTLNMTVFQPQETLAIIRNINLGSGTHEVKVDTEFGEGDSDSFNI